MRFKSKNFKLLKAKCAQITRRTDLQVTLEFNPTYSPFSWQIKIGDHYPQNSNFTAQELARFIDGFVIGYHWQEDNR